MEAVLGIIGGYGLYDCPVSNAREWRQIDGPGASRRTRFCSASSTGCRVVFLPRHGRGHRLSPTRINYRANIDALKRAGVTDIVSVSACGSLARGLPPGQFVIVDQFIDRTFAREKSFFGDGLTSRMSRWRIRSARCLAERDRRRGQGEAFPVQRGGTYLVMEGPQFSTLAESRSLSVLGLRRHRHDQHAGGQARPRSGDLPTRPSPWSPTTTAGTTSTRRSTSRR